MALSVSLESLRTRDAQVLHQWFGVSSSPETLEEIGAQLGVSRERIRQLRNRGIEHLRQRWRWPQLLDERMSALLTDRHSPLYLDEVASLDPWFTGFTDNTQLLKRLIDEFVGDSINTWPLRGRLIASRCDSERWSELLDEARTALHNAMPHGVTRAQAREVISGPAIAGGWLDLSEALWNVIEPSLNFGVIGPNGEEHLASIGTGLGKVIAALLRESPRALHISEIVEGLRLRDVVTTDDYATRNLLRSAMRSAGAILMGRSLYGHDGHLPVDRDIADEVLAEVELLMSSSAPERQWHCTELVEAIAARQPGLADEVDQYVVNAIMQRSKEAQYLGRLVWTRSGGGTGTHDRLAILAACEDALVRAGGPLNKAQLREAIEQSRGLNHNFLPPVSARVVRLSRGRWGLADRDVGVSASSQQNALAALERCLQTRQKGLHLTEVFAALNTSGFFADPMFDAQELFGLAQGDGRFRLGRGQMLGLAEWSDVRRVSLTRALDRLKTTWVGPLRGEELCAKVAAITERQVGNSSALWSASQAGFVFSPLTQTWDLAIGEVDTVSPDVAPESVLEESW